MKDLIEKKVAQLTSLKLPDWVLKQAEAELAADLEKLIDKKITPAFLEASFKKCIEASGPSKATPPAPPKKA